MSRNEKKYVVVPDSGGAGPIWIVPLALALWLPVIIFALHEF
jgi:hypothetical protein